MPDVATLHQLGPIEAWRRIRFRLGRRSTLNLLCALECALRGLNWRHLDEARKNALRRAAREIDASLGLAPSAKPRRKGSKG